MQLVKITKRSRKTSKDIQTPLAVLGDDPVSARVDWASKIALAAIELKLKPENLPKAIRDCYAFPAIEKLMMFSAAQLDKESDIKAHLDANLASIWSSMSYNSRTRHYLDPLLLGDAPYDALAHLTMKDGSIPSSAIETYERLYFNCRGEDVKTCMSTIRSHMIAYGGLDNIVAVPSPVDGMKRVGLRYGYTALAEILGIWDVEDRKEDMTDLQNAVLQRRLVSYDFAIRCLCGLVNAEDSVAFMNAQQSYEKQLKEESMQVQDGDEYSTAMVNIFNMLPDPVKAAHQAPSAEASEKLARKKREMEGKISKVKIEDAGIEGANRKHKERIDKDLSKQAEEVTSGRRNSK